MSPRGLSEMLLLAVMVSACTAQPDTVMLDCESGHKLDVIVKDEHAHFTHDGKQYTLPQKSPDKFQGGDMTLKLAGSDASLRISDQVILWGCEVRSD